MDLPDALVGLEKSQDTLEPLFGLKQADTPCPGELMQVANCTEGVGKLKTKSKQTNIYLEKMKQEIQRKIIFFVFQRSVTISLSGDLSRMLLLQKQVETVTFSFDDVVE